MLCCKYPSLHYKTMILSCYSLSKVGKQKSIQVKTSGRNYCNSAFQYVAGKRRCITGIDRKAIANPPTSRSTNCAQWIYQSGSLATYLVDLCGYVYSMSIQGTLVNAVWALNAPGKPTDEIARALRARSRCPQLQAPVSKHIHQSRYFQKLS